MAMYPTRTRRWTRAEYDRLIEVGIFRPEEPLELLGGELVVSEPQGSRHYTAIARVVRSLQAAFGMGWVVRMQGPVALDDESEPEPDVAVVPGTLDDYNDAHPAWPVLVVEVADSRLSFDQKHKGSLYARAQLADYWILNLGDRVLEVYRQPARDTTAAFGWRYAETITLTAESSVTPLAKPTARVAVASLLPRR